MHILHVEVHNIIMYLPLMQNMSPPAKSMSYIIVEHRIAAANRKERKITALILYQLKKEMAGDCAATIAPQLSCTHMR